MKTYVYIHVCCINNWKEIFNNILSHIKTSGLHESIEKIRCNILTQNKDDISWFQDDKIEIIGTSHNLNLYETSTINLLYRDATMDDFHVLYLHTKGVKHNNSNQCVNDWVEFLCYFNIQKHDICRNQLENYNCVGANLSTSDCIRHPVHYTGNFWWSTSNYIRSLEPCIQKTYNSPEFWLTENRQGRFLSLWNSNLDHYYDRYDSSNYVDKPFQNIEVIIT